jgi:GntR family transcriptional regulator, transcriptional repressor for pyruvate dehydrogenase complex
VKFEELARSSVSEQVASRITEAIIKGDFRAAEPLPPERELSEMFGVSRASIREALRVLRVQGLIVTKGPPPTRAVVADVAGGPLRDVLVNLLQLERVGLQDLVDFRYVLESAAFERSAKARDPEAIEEARQALDEMRKIRADLERFHRADVRFHLALIRGSGNEVMYLVMLAVREAVARYMFEALRALYERPGGLKLLVQEHEDLIEAVEQGNPARASELIREHIIDFHEAFLEAHAASEASL